MKCKLSIQEKLKDLRIERGLSLQELSDQTGLSRAALGNYETDDYKEITHKAIVILADFYGVSSDYLLGLTENREHHSFPVDELGLKDDADRNLQPLRNKIKEANIEEIIVVCPNCYYFLGSKLDVKIVTILF